nr:matrix metalloproteinase-2-like [Halyomorpha halys]
MRKFGYIEGSEGGLAAQPLLGNIMEPKFKEAIKEVQKFGGIEITGELDNKTLELMSAKRCGVQDIVKDTPTYPPTNEDLPPKVEDNDEHHHEHQHHHHHHHHDHHIRTKRYNLFRGWNKRHLTFYLDNWPNHLRREEVQYVVEKALGIWAKYGNLHFTQAPYSNDADIVFGFYRRQHGDSFAFDGPGNVLAHAFTPSYNQNGRGIDGDVHFDADENWMVDSNPGDYGVDLMSTALHELGHSLGLNHSPDRGSVMFAYYTGSNHELGYDDILAMHELYIRRRLIDDGEGHGYTPPILNRPPPTRRVATTSSTTTRTSTTMRYDETTRSKYWHGSYHGSKPQAGCNGGFDTVTFIRGELFITKKKMLWRLNGPGQVQKNYPVEFRRMFALPEHVKSIDAMYERKNDSGIVIFSGDQFWVFDGTILSSPRPLTDYGLPWSTANVDAVTVRNGSTYIFSDFDYWTFDDEQKTLISTSRPLRDWGIPPNTKVDSVMTYKDGNTYFFKGDRYWIYNGRFLSEPRTGPKSASEFWLSC